MFARLQPIPGPGRSSPCARELRECDVRSQLVVEYDFMPYNKLVLRQTQCSTTYTIGVHVSALRVGPSSAGTMNEKYERRVALQPIGIRSELRGGSMHSRTGKCVRKGTGV